MSANPNAVLEKVRESLSDNILRTYEFRGETTFYVNKDKILDICLFLKNEYRFLFIADLTAADYMGIRTPRFEVIYLLHRFDKYYEDNTRIRLKAELSEENPRISSVTSVWKGANWFEREVYDMFGIEFTGHPDHRRILMPDDFGEHPLRKDFDVRNREPSKQSFQKDLISGNF